MVPGRGGARAGRRRHAPVLARRDARHHRAEEHRGEVDAQPRDPLADARATADPRLASRGGAGAGAPPDRGRHPRRLDPGDVGDRHAAADARGGDRGPQASG